MYNELGKLWYRIKYIAFFYLEETQSGLELASQSYQWILEEESHTIDLLPIKLDKHE